VLFTRTFGEFLQKFARGVGGHRPRDFSPVTTLAACGNPIEPYRAWIVPVTCQVGQAAGSRWPQPTHHHAPSQCQGR
jgi:hypothetical protein